MEKEEKKAKIFEGRRIRTHWDEEKEKWFFSIVDIIEVLTESSRPRKYWADLKAKLKEEGSELSDKIGQLKLVAEDGKERETDVADTEQVLRLIQSIPSKKAEPFKLWLAKVGNERIDETHNPELAIDRAMKTYLKKGYSKEWINQRLKTIEVRKELTDEWERAGIEEEQDFAILTDEITKAWSDLSVKEYKQLKNLKKESLRDNMTNLELVLNMLAEAATKEISKKENPEGVSESVVVAKRGGNVAKTAREKLEEETGESIISDENYLNEEERLLREKRKKKKLLEINS